MRASEKKQHTEIKPQKGSPEWNLLIATARLNLDDKGTAEIERLLKFDINWDLLVSQSLIHGTSGLLLRHLTSLRDDTRVPTSVIDRLRDFQMKITASNLLQIAGFKEAADAFADIGVDLIVLKGITLVENLYGDIGLRPMSDVDVLIREKDWQKAIKVLKALNYRSSGQDLDTLPPKLTKYDIKSHVQYVSQNGTCVEFQFDLFTLGIGMIDIDGVWERSRKAVICGADVRILGPEDQLLHLVVHASRHGCARLKWLVDIAETLRQDKEIDWDLLITTAHREKVGAIVYLTLEHIQNILKLDVLPKSALERLRPRTSQRAVWSIIWPQKSFYDFRGRYEDGVCYYYYRPLSGWNILNYILMGRFRDKIHYQARWIAPSLDWMADNYGQPRSMKLLRYYPVRFTDRVKKERTEKL